MINFLFELTFINSQCYLTNKFDICIPVKILLPSIVTVSVDMGHCRDICTIFQMIQEEIKRMGLLFSTIMQLFETQKQEKRIVMVGLDNAGKTTILNRLSGDDITKDAHPTIGFNTRSITYRDDTIIVFDMGGLDKLRPSWKHYYQDVHGIIFVYDISDFERFDEVNEELDNLFSCEYLKQVPILILENKIDKVDTVEVSIEDNFPILKSTKLKWFAQPCSSLKNTGILKD